MRRWLSAMIVLLVLRATPGRTANGVPRHRGCVPVPRRPRRPIMERKVDKTKVDPLTGAEEAKPAAPLETVPDGQPANATTAVTPGTGRPVQDGDQEKRVVTP